MQPDIAETLVEDFERGLLSRRQLACRLMGLGAALAVMPRAAEARQGQGSTFQATGLDHVALNVRSVPRSRDFYIKHLVQVSQIPRRFSSGPAGEIPPGESIVERCWRPGSPAKVSLTLFG